MKPLPPRTNYHSTEIPPAPPSTLRDPLASTPAPTPTALPATPAPTPPPSPIQKTKKQQYQTDPNKPFLFPYTRSSDPTSLVPFAIQEADKLYQKHQYVSLGIYQLWQEREECLREERGLGMSGLIGFDKLSLDDDEEEDEATMEAMLREYKYEEEEMACNENGDKEGVKAARQKLASSKRLRRVDIIYASPPRPVRSLITETYTSNHAELCDSPSQTPARHSHRPRSTRRKHASPSTIRCVSYKRTTSYVFHLPT